MVRTVTKFEHELIRFDGESLYFGNRFRPFVRCRDADAVFILSRVRENVGDVQIPSPFSANFTELDVFLAGFRSRRDIFYAVNYSCAKFFNEVIKGEVRYLLSVVHFTRKVLDGKISWFRLHSEFDERVSEIVVVAFRIFNVHSERSRFKLYYFVFCKVTAPSAIKFLFPNDSLCAVTGADFNVICCGIGDIRCADINIIECVCIADCKVDDVCFDDCHVNVFYCKAVIARVFPGDFKALNRRADVDTTHCNGNHCFVAWKQFGGCA